MPEYSSRGRTRRWCGPVHGGHNDRIVIVSCGFDMGECLARVLGFFGTCGRIYIDGVFFFLFSIINYWALFPILFFWLNIYKFGKTPGFMGVGLC